MREKMTNYLVNLWKGGTFSLKDGQSLPQHSRCSWWRSAHWAGGSPFENRTSTIKRYVSCDVKLEYWDNKEGIADDEVGEFCIFRYLSICWWGQNTHHNNLVDSPDGLAHEMGKLEGEITFSPFPFHWGFNRCPVTKYMIFPNLFIFLPLWHYTL